jgi:hypothetical protein
VNNASEQPASGAKLSAVSYHVSYSAEEDRLLISLEVSPEREYAMGLTRRLAKLLIGALADLQVKKKDADRAAEPTIARPAGRRKLEALRRDPVVRDTVLSFEHTHAVAQSIATGDTRPRARGKPLVSAPLLIREVKITPKQDGGAIVHLDNRQQVLTLDLDARRIHSLMAGILELAEKVGWDFPVIAAWLERAAGPSSQAVH